MGALPDKQGICALLCDHEALKFPYKYNWISNDMHVRCVIYLQQFQSKSRVQNRVVNALSRKITLLVNLKWEITRFDCLE